MIFWADPLPLGAPATGLPAEAEFVSPPASCLQKADPGTRLYRLPFGAGTLMHKLYSYDAWYLAVRARLFPSRARREFEVLRELRARGVPTLAPVCFGEDDVGARRRHSWIATVFLDDVETLEARLQARPPRAERADLVATIAATVAAMHAAGFAHGGLFPRNILLTPGTAPRVFDAPFGRFYPGPVPLLARAADLACLLRFTDSCVRPTERARFLRVYLGRAPGEGWGPAGRRLARATLASAAFTRSVRRRALFHLRRWFGGGE